MRKTGVGLLLLAIAPAAEASDRPTFSLPISCVLGETCFVQNYPDVDPSAGVRDYRCGSSSYNGHKGTDVRLLSTKAAKKGVAVLAAAAGRVKALRDGETDRLLGKDTPHVEGKECGNGVVIDHGNGWETQYCHLLKGSIRVAKGQRVTPGDTLGQVGYSGKTEFAHVHFSVRHNRKTIDPFTGQALSDGVCGQDGRGTLWRPEAAAALIHRPGELIELGFADAPVKSRDLELGTVGSALPLPESPALVFFARFINLRAGDRFRISVRGPKGLIARKTLKALDRPKAQYVVFAGRKRRDAPWPAGTYSGSVQVIRDSNIVLQGRATTVLR